LKDFGGEARRKRPVGRCRCRWEDINKMELREIGWGGMDCFDEREGCSGRLT
jgi:hypothetical protein